MKSFETLTLFLTLTGVVSMLTFIYFYIRKQLKLKDTTALLVRCHYIKSRYPLRLTLAPPLQEEEKLLHLQVLNLTRWRGPHLTRSKCLHALVCARSRAWVGCPSGGTVFPVTGVRQRKDKIRWRTSLRMSTQRSAVFIRCLANVCISVLLYSPVVFWTYPFKGSVTEHPADIFISFLNKSQVFDSCSGTKLH